MLLQVGVSYAGNLQRNQRYATSTFSVISYRANRLLA